MRETVGVVLAEAPQSPVILVGVDRGALECECSQDDAKPAGAVRGADGEEVTGAGGSEPGQEAAEGLGASGDKERPAVAAVTAATHEGLGERPSASGEHTVSTSAEGAIAMAEVNEVTVAAPSASSAEGGVNGVSKPT